VLPMDQLFARETLACWFSYGGWFSGMAQGFPSKHVELRRSQYASFLSLPSLARLPGSMIQGKMRNCRALPRRNTKTGRGAVLDQLREPAASAGHAGGYPSLLGIEGTRMPGKPPVTSQRVTRKNSQTTALAERRIRSGHGGTVCASPLPGHHGRAP
jgi:hypothetical protein